MTDPRKREHELLIPTEAARRVGLSRNGVLSRVARKVYESEVVGGVTFVVADERFLADVQAAEEAAQEQANVAVA